MTGRNTAVAVNAILLGTSLLWCWYVVQSIPPGTGGGDVGPRAIPLLLGVLLGLMSAGMILNGLFGYSRAAGTDLLLPDDLAEEADAASNPPIGTNARDEVVVVAFVFALLFGYGWALRMIGFNLATFLIIMLTMLLCLRERSPVRLVSMSFGVTFVCWLIFGQLLDIPLATGIWINLG